MAQINSLQLLSHILLSTNTVYSNCSHLILSLLIGLIIFAISNCSASLLLSGHFEAEEFSTSVTPNRCQCLRRTWILLSKVQGKRRILYCVRIGALDKHILFDYFYSTQKLLHLCVAFCFLYAEAKNIWWLFFQISGTISNLQFHQQKVTLKLVCPRISSTLTFIGLDEDACLLLSIVPYQLKQLYC